MSNQVQGNDLGALRIQCLSGMQRRLALIFAVLGDNMNRSQVG